MEKGLKSIPQKIIALSSITEMDVCVVNSDLVRIAGTGRYSSVISEKVHNKSLYYRLFHSDDKHLLVKPRKDKVCNSCEYLYNCSGLIHLAVPLIIKKCKAMALVLTATKDYTKRELANDTSLYLRLIDYFNKEIEKEMQLIASDEVDCIKKCIQMLINTINKNVMIMKKDAVLYINNNLKNLFGLNQHDNCNKIQDILKFNNERIGKEKLEVSADILGERRHFRMFPKTIDNASDLKIVFVEALKAKSKSYFDEQIFYSLSVKKAVDIAKKSAVSDATVMLVGESGTGKEVFAKGIHFESNRSKAPLISVNCAAIPETLYESEFFGYADGAFTGAKRGGKIGKFQAADKGTLFLDEVGEMPLPMQAKLLRALDTKTITPVGSNKPIDVDVRIVSATNKNLETRVEQGLFRRDLYYRLNVIKIKIPPLRERKDDIIPLANHFLYNSEINDDGRAMKLTTEVCDRLINYSWPGNIRELKNAIEYAVTICRDYYITIEDLPTHIIEEGDKNSHSSLSEICSIEDYEYNALKACIGTYGLTKEGKEKTAQKLGMSRATLYRRLKKYNLL
jgi:transcriptional regulator with PAS, ATPase and Fis domain